MFSQAQPMQVAIKSVYQISRSALEHTVAANISRHTPHSFRFVLRGEAGYMTVDGIEEARKKFLFPENMNGYFSLASNGSLTEPGGFRYIRLKTASGVSLDIDFSKLSSVNDLEGYFDCYHFPTADCKGTGLPSPIRNFWALNERGCLVCARPNTGRIPFGDKGPFCLLTLRGGEIGDFEVEVGFEQCWRRYGILFGCKKQTFPFYHLPNSWKTISVRGVLALADSHLGACFLRGSLLDNDSNQPTSMHRQDHPLVAPLFSSEEQTTLPLHTLTYHFTDTVTYHCDSQQFHPTVGEVMYLPPSIPCELKSEVAEDVILRVEFESDQTFPPSLISPKRPEVVRRIFEELDSVWNGELPDRSWRALSVFYRLMGELSQTYTDSNTVVVRRALHYIHNHFTDPTLTVKEITNSIDVCESSFYHIFYTACGMKPKEYILNCRLQHACALLETQQYKIYEVAEKAGFSDAKYFMTAFKREMGISPGKYKKQHT